MIDRVKAVGLGLLVTGILAGLILLGSRNLAHFDAALVGYTFATLFAAFAITYRYTVWLQRPPTRRFWIRGWQAFLDPRRFGKNLMVAARRLISGFAGNLFIWRRGVTRGLAHWLFMWGCLLAASITFPLVFGWLHFETVPGRFDLYRTYLFGFPTFTFAIESVFAMILFHGLVWASFLVIAGVMLAMRRRMSDRGAGALQQFGEDFMPLILLFAISVTGLALVVSYEWMHGYAYEFLAILHAATVIITLVYLPFGKFFHIFQRPAQIGVAFYRDQAASGPQAACRRCGEDFASLMQVKDLIDVEAQLGFDYRMPGSPVEHYQWICPRCRRSLLALTQGRAWQRAGEAHGD